MGRRVWFRLEDWGRPTDAGKDSGLQILKIKYEEGGRKYSFKISTSQQFAEGNEGHESGN